MPKDRSLSPGKQASNQELLSGLIAQLLPCRNPLIGPASIVDRSRFDIPHDNRGDAHFMWYFALLSLIPKWLERWVTILGPILFGLFLILVPLLGGRGECSPLRRPWSILIIAFVVVTIGHYWIVGIRAPWSPRLDAPPLPASVVGAASSPIADGARVFYDKSCEYCHTISGYGGIRGPDLSDAGDRMGPAQIATRIVSGAENMPSYRENLKPEELASLLAFLASRHRVQMIRWEGHDNVVPSND